MFECFERYLLANTELAPPEIELICRLAMRRKMKRREALLHEGETARYMVFITKGLLRTFRRDESGKEFIVKFSSEHRWLTDKESYQYVRPSKVTIEALENSELLLWKKADFEELIQRLPGFHQLLKELSLKNQVAQQGRLYQAMTATAEEKYWRFAQKQAAILNRVPLHMVASYLGLSRETLSRIRKTN